MQTLVYASLCFAALSRLVAVLSCRRYGLSPHEMSMPIAISVLGDYAVPLARAMARKRAPLARELLDALLESLAVYAPAPNRTNAIRSFTNR
ncbi:MAG: hypothetical protein HYY93_05120 [Planctomycetes bacterium]|nr:hypothetical protein [Planctomycetota bacterium]